MTTLAAQKVITSAASGACLVVVLEERASAAVGVDDLHTASASRRRDMVSASRRRDMVSTESNSRSDAIIPLRLINSQHVKHVTWLRGSR